MSATAAKGQAIWIASAAEDAKTILLGSETAKTPNFQLDTMISCSTSNRAKRYLACTPSIKNKEKE